MVLVIVIIIIFGASLGIWLSTLRVIQPQQGQLYVLTKFNKHIAIIGCGIPDIPISEDRFDPTILYNKEPLKILVDMDSSFLVAIWPIKIAVFEYRYKKFRTRKEVAETGGMPIFEPEAGLDKNNNPIKDNDPNTTILGEWAEKNKTSLFARERDDIAIYIRSVDGVEAVVYGFIKYLTWNMSAAVSTTYQAKLDPEKSIIDRFQDWAKDKKYFKEIQGISFENIEPDNARKFFRDLNKSIYLTGIIVEDVELTRFIIRPQSMDIAEALEQVIENEFRLSAEEIESKRKIVEGEGTKAKMLLENVGKQDLLNKQAEVEISKDKGLKLNQADLIQKQATIDVDKDKGIRQNEVDQYSKERAIDLDVNGKLLTKLTEYKKVADVTEVQKFEHLGKVTGTVVIHEAGSDGGSHLDDVLEGNIIAKSFKTKEKGGGNA